MTRGQVVFYTAILVVLGAGWGLTIPLTKIAVSTGFGHFGLIFWQLVIGSVLLACLSLARGKGLPFNKKTLRVYVVIALVGTLVPNSASYQAAVHIPAGIMSLLLSMIPMFAFPMAVAMGVDHYQWRRLLGLCFGLTGVLVIVMPGVSSTLQAPVFWMLIALIAGFCYAMEGNIVAKWGTAGLDAVQVLFGASIVGALGILPVTIASGQFIDPRDLGGVAGQALILASVAHALVYSGYVWLVGRAGPVFTVQTSYLVTGFGLLWAKLILAEAYPPAVWAALGLIFVGMYLVQPRNKDALAPT